MQATDLIAYRETLKRRRLEEQAQLAQRFVRAQVLAKQAAALLKQAFGVQQVLLFGSLVHGHWFSQTSDVDLAVWGLDPDHYFVAVSRLQDLSPEFKVDLVAMERCSPSLRQAVLQACQPL